MFCSKKCAKKYKKYARLLLLNRCECGKEKWAIHKYCSECAKKYQVCECCGKKLKKGEKMGCESKGIKLIDDAIKYLMGRQPKKTEPKFGDKTLFENEQEVKEDEGK